MWDEDIKKYDSWMEIRNKHDAFVVAGNSM